MFIPARLRNLREREGGEEEGEEVARRALMDSERKNDAKKDERTGQQYSDEKVLSEQPQFVVTDTKKQIMF